MTPDFEFQMDCLAVWEELCENRDRYRAIFEDGGTVETREWTIRTLTPWVNEVYNLIDDGVRGDYAYDWGWVPTILQQITDHKNMPTPASVVAAVVMSVA